MARTVLLIEHDTKLRDFVCTALEADGFVAVGVGSYPEAIEQLTWSPADLAISDGFTADGLSGVSRLHRWFPYLQQVVFSGGVTEQAAARFSTQHLAILPKPVTLETIRQAVYQTLTPEADVYLQEILDRGRLGFYMAVLR